MNGLELSRAFFGTYGERVLSCLPEELRYRASAGLVGPGSECLGFDDELSRDHDFGPGFCIWLPRDTYREWGAELQRSYDLLPKRFGGFERHEDPMAGQRVGVFETEAFLKTYTGLERAPRTSREWLAIPETFLCVLTSGEVFFDPSGTMAATRLPYQGFYPEPVVRKKVAADFASMAQAGQYNLPRSQKRRDPLAANSARGEFISSLAAVLHLFVREYAPFYKWTLRSLVERVHASKAVVGTVERIAGMPALEIDQRDVEACCALVLGVARRLGWTHTESDFLLDAALDIHRHLEDPYLAACPLGAGEFR